MTQHHIEHIEVRDFSQPQPEPVEVAVEPAPRVGFITRLAEKGNEGITGRTANALNASRNGRPAVLELVASEEEPFTPEEPLRRRMRRVDSVEGLSQNKKRTKDLTGQLGHVENVHLYRALD